MNEFLFRVGTNKKEFHRDCFRPELRFSDLSRVELHGPDDRGNFTRLGFNLPMLETTTRSTDDDVYEYETLIPLKITIDYMIIGKNINRHELVIDLPSPIRH
jgi:hypothetical protein